RIVPVVSFAETDAHAVGHISLIMSAVQLDPKWNHGEYYGKEEPMEGLKLGVKLLLHPCWRPAWEEKTFGRKWAQPCKGTAKGWDSRFAVEAQVDTYLADRFKAMDANSFLYMEKAVQLFRTGHLATLKDGLSRITGKTLLIPAKTDLLTFPEYSKQAMQM